MDRTYTDSDAEPIGYAYSIFFAVSLALAHSNAFPEPYFHAVTLSESVAIPNWFPDANTFSVTISVSKLPCNWRD